MRVGKPLAAVVLTLGLSAGAARAVCAPVDHAHAQWSVMLARWVSGGSVDYAGIKREAEGQLTSYLEILSGTCATDYQTWSRAQRIAFWINTYNAFTVRLILDHYPVTSIRKIGWLPLAAFRERFIPMPGLKGGKISLNEIEHDTLRAHFREPRIHFALSLDYSREDAATYLRSNRLPWKQLHEPGGFEGRLAKELGVMTAPLMIVVGADGRVVNRDIQLAELEDELKKLLSERVGRRE
jgi:hypothetical protein